MLSPSLQAKVNILIFSQCFLGNDLFEHLFKTKRVNQSKIDGIEYTLESCVQSLVSKCKAELREPDAKIMV